MNLWKKGIVMVSLMIGGVLFAGMPERGVAVGQEPTPTPTSPPQPTPPPPPPPVGACAADPDVPGPQSVNLMLYHGGQANRPVAPEQEGKVPGAFTAPELLMKLMLCLPSPEAINWKKDGGGVTVSVNQGHAVLWDSKTCQWVKTLNFFQQGEVPSQGVTLSVKATQPSATLGDIVICAKTGQEGAAGCSDTVVATAVGMTGKFRIIGEPNTPYFKEESLDEVPDKNVTTKQEGIFFRTLGGMRLHLKVVPDKIEQYVDGYVWTQNGQYYPDYRTTNWPNSLSDAQLTGARVAGQPWQIREVYWQSPARADVDASLTMSLLMKDDAIEWFLPITRQIKSRVLKLTSPTKMKGDDVNMLQAVLRSLGTSHKPKLKTCPKNGADEDYGICGTPVVISGQYDENLHRAVSRLQYQDLIFLKPAPNPKKRSESFNEVLNGQHSVDIETLKQIQEHWNDYLAAFDAYPLTPEIKRGVPANEFPGWLSQCAQELATTYTNHFVARAHNIPETQQQCDANREALLKAWISQEASHWGTQGISHRIVLGGYDNAGSIGFSQIQNWFKYAVPGHIHPNPDIGGKRSGSLQNINLYHPENNLRGFAVWANASDGGGSFYHAFHPDGKFPSEVTYQSNPYPRIIFYPVEPEEQIPNITRYKDQSADRLSKGLMAYNRGNGVGANILKKEIWPDLLRKYHPQNPKIYASYWLNNADTRTGIIKGIRYALEIKANVPIALQGRIWRWKDRIITTGPDGICQTNAADDDIQLVAVGQQNQPHTVAIMAGRNGVLNTSIRACFTQEEYANFLVVYAAPIQAMLESLKVESADSVCFEMATILDNQNSLGAQVVQALHGRCVDRMEEIEVSYSEADWLDPNQSYVGACQQVVNQRYP